MKKIISAISFIFISVLISCGGDATTKTTTAVEGDSIFNAGNAAYMGSDAKPEQGQNIESLTNGEQKTGKVNPPHGQPGHICETPVASTIPGNPSSPNITQQATSTPIQNVTLPTTTKVAAGMNPAHGQPGHRCDISVGAPLTDAAAKTSNDPNINYPVVSSPMEYKVPLPGANTKVAAGMNPAHGQPGHDCAIAVGAPLPKN